MKIIDVITYRLYVIFPEISGKFPEILNFWKIYNPSCSFIFFLVVRYGMFLCFFSVCGCMLCLVRYLFVISTSVIDCLGRFVPEMTYYILRLFITKVDIQ